MLERRDFLKLACASLSLSALPGCGSDGESAVLVPSSANGASSGASAIPLRERSSRKASGHCN